MEIDTDSALAVSPQKTTGNFDLLVTVEDTVYCVCIINSVSALRRTQYVSVTMAKQLREEKCSHLL